MVTVYVVIHVGPGSTTDATALSGMVKNDFQKQMKEYQAQQKRKSF
jgi:translation elongation factor EF-Tu-like GTPase